MNYRGDGLLLSVASLRRAWQREGNSLQQPLCLREKVVVFEGLIDKVGDREKRLWRNIETESREKFHGGFGRNRFMRNMSRGSADAGLSYPRDSRDLIDTFLMKMAAVDSLEPSFQPLCIRN